jgi:hypothetical protein
MTTTPNFGLNKPTVGGDRNVWGGKWNANADLIDRHLYQPDDVAALLADTQYTYTAGSAWTVTAGQYIRTAAEGFNYEVAASGATDHHVTTAGGVKLYVAPASVIGASAFGANPAASDNAAAFNAISAYILENAPGTLYIPEGTYRSTSAIKNTRGVNVIGQGKVVLTAIGSTRVYEVGDRQIDAGSYTSNLPTLASPVTAGDTTLTFSSAPPVVAGDIIRLMSSSSTNSSVGNVIPRFKDWLQVQSVSGSVVTLDTRPRYSHGVADNTFVDRVDCVGGVTENITIAVTDPPFSGPYPWQVDQAFGHTFRHFRAQNSASYVAFSDQIAFENCELQGFNSGASTARGAGRVSFRHCTIRTGVNQPNGASAFIEESPDRVFFENCDFHGMFQAGSSADNTPPKSVVARGGRIFSTGAAISLVGFYNADGYALDVDGMTFYAPGGIPTTYSGPKTVVAVAFADSARVVNCNFVGIASDAHTIAASAIGAFRLDYYGNIEGGLGKDNSSLGTATTRPLPFSTHSLEALGVKFSTTSPLSANANTLDYYEEGTFNPTITTTGTDFTSVTYGSVRSGVYTRIGNRVFIDIEMGITAITVGSASGDVVIGGLPFTNAAFRNSAFSIANVRSWGTRPNSAEIDGAVTYINLFKQSAIGADDVKLTVADASSGNLLLTLTGSYMVG